MTVNVSDRAQPGPPAPVQAAAAAFGATMTFTIPDSTFHAPDASQYLRSFTRKEIGTRTVLPGMMVPVRR